MRREFPAKVQAQAFLRANGKCEGKNCWARLSLGKYHFDAAGTKAYWGQAAKQVRLFTGFQVQKENKRRSGAEMSAIHNKSTGMR